MSGWAVSLIGCPAPFEAAFILPESVLWVEGDGLICLFVWSA